MSNSRIIKRLRTAINAALALLFVIAISIEGFHHHHDGKTHSNCPICQFSIQNSSPDVPDDQERLFFPPLLFRRGTDRPPAVNLFEILGFCYPNAPPFYFS